MLALRLSDDLRWNKEKEEEEEEEEGRLRGKGREQKKLSIPQACIPSHLVSFPTISREFPAVPNNRQKDYSYIFFFTTSFPIPRYYS